MMSNSAVPPPSSPQTGSLEETIWHITRRAWEVFKADAVLYVLATLVVVVLGTLTLGVLLAPLTVGFIRIVRKRLRGEPAEVGDIFGGLSTFLTSFLIFLIVGVGTCIGLMLLVVPGVVVMLFTAFALHFIAYRNDGVGACLTAAVDLAKNHLLLVVIVLFGLSLLNTLGGMVLIGLVLTLPYTIVAMTVAFEDLTGLK